MVGAGAGESRRDGSNTVQHARDFCVSITFFGLHLKSIDDSMIGKTLESLPCDMSLADRLGNTVHPELNSSLKPGVYLVVRALRPPSSQQATGRLREVLALPCYYVDCDL